MHKRDDAADDAPRLARLTCSIAENGTYADVNDVWCAVYGYSREEAIGSPVVALLRPGENVTEREAEILRQLDALRSRQSTSETFTGSGRAKDGHIVVVTATATWHPLHRKWELVADVPDPIGLTRARATQERLVQLLLDEASGSRFEHAMHRLEALISNVAGVRHADDDPHARRFVIVEWRTWSGFRKWFQDREAEALAPPQPRPARWRPPRITKKLLGGQLGGDSRKTITRAMHYYRVDPKRAWPPSIWPEADPRLTLQPGENWPPPHWSPLQRLGVIVVGQLGQLGAQQLADGRLLRLGHVGAHFCTCCLVPEALALVVLAYNGFLLEDGWADTLLDFGHTLLPIVLPS
jgi:PAS domain S-box-containing protein